MFLSIYKALMTLSTPLLRGLLAWRLRKGKEETARVAERRGLASAPRPEGRLVWFHGASVGEAQSTLILVDALRARDPALNILITTGTLGSAELMAKRLPQGAVHQYVPLDHPYWVGRFLDYWKPDAAIWMESEIWPNMLGALRERLIPAALVNARLSPRSVKIWGMSGGAIKKILSTFQIILAQTEEDGANFRKLGAGNVVVSDNIKYASASLPVSEEQRLSLQRALQGRPFWVYASTHDGEEQLACRLHQRIAPRVPGLLTVIVPRHPARREEIRAKTASYNLNIAMRTEASVPAQDTDVYVADTMGELGLFYALAPVSCIGRSFSNDGGGGHNPIEAAQLGSAVLHGPNVQNLAAIFEEMDEAGVALRMADEEQFAQTLERMLSDTAFLDDYRKRAASFAQRKAHILNVVMDGITPILPKPAGR